MNTQCRYANERLPIDATNSWKYTDMCDGSGSTSADLNEQHFGSNFKLGRCTGALLRVMAFRARFTSTETPVRYFGSELTHHVAINKSS